MSQYNICDCCTNGTKEEVRKLPIRGGGNLLICKKHFAREMEFRQKAGLKIVNWNDLSIEAIKIYPPDVLLARHIISLNSHVGEIGAGKMARMKELAREVLVCRGIEVE